MAPVLVAVFGQNPQTASGVADGMKPGYETVHICLSLDTALAELPALFSGDAVKPASGLGTNAEAEVAKVPKYLIFGAGLPAEDVAKATEAVTAKCPEAKFVQVNKEDMIAAGASGPDPKVISEVLKSKIAEMEKA
ncbi:hypothetical protein MKZ38_005184 [Zalerion maritima]|uniref:Uncharacterized protein n=1 Tax=Zalerion maritima TaxID=339359 RepID=A0AAD5RWA7_9PEZI|nr:hypothetical protein MKZ38_005184 [Zalerion maritima]